jgi:hypothetical protein
VRFAQDVELVLLSPVRFGSDNAVWLGRGDSVASGRVVAPTGRWVTSSAWTVTTHRERTPTFVEERARNNAAGITPITCTSPRMDADVRASRTS